LALGLVAVLGCGSAAQAGDRSCARRASASDESVSVPCNERLAGNWSGLVTESSGQSYRVDISLAKAGDGTVSYNSLSCSGLLTYLGRHGEKYSYKETITEGAAKCTNGGAIELAVVAGEGSSLDYKWTGESLTVTGRISGVMTAGVTAGANTASRPASDGKDECTRYLPNRESWVPTPCGGEEDQESSD
jgi:hypothetical protein